MTAVGLEVRDRVVVAVAIDERGARLGRADRPAGADAGAAALDAIAEVSPASGAALVGIAAGDPASAAVGRLLETLKGRGAGASADRVVTPGTAAALAEAWIGAARGAHDVVYLSLSEHVTAGVVRGGVSVTGARGRAASVAWMSLNPVEREDYRKAGCLEAEVSAAGIVRRLIWRIKAGDESRVSAMVAGDLAAITLAHVLDAAQARDGVSISVMRDTARYIGMAAANLVAIADPETLVLGGTLAASPEVLFDLVKLEIARRLPDVMTKALTIAPAVLGDDAAAIGAARLALIARP